MIFFYYTFIVLFLLVSFLLCCIILMQESKSSGFGASFGGDSGESLFGTATADVLKRATAWLSTCFLVGCILLSLWTGRLGSPKAHARPVESEEVIQP